MSGNMLLDLYKLNVQHYLVVFDKMHNFLLSLKSCFETIA